MNLGTIAVCEHWHDRMVAPIATVVTNTIAISITNTITIAILSQLRSQLAEGEISFNLGMAKVAL